MMLGRPRMFFAILLVAQLCLVASQRVHPRTDHGNQSKARDQTTVHHPFSPSEHGLSVQWPGYLPGEIFSGDSIMATCKVPLDAAPYIQWQLGTRHTMYTVYVDTRSPAMHLYPWLQAINSPAREFDPESGQPFTSVVEVKARKMLDGAKLGCWVHYKADPGMRRRSMLQESKRMSFSYGVRKAVLTSESERVNGRETWTVTCSTHLGDSHAMTWVAISPNDGFVFWLKMFTNITTTLVRGKLRGIQVTFKNAYVSEEAGNVIVSRMHVGPAWIARRICARCYPYDPATGRPKHLKSHFNTEELMSELCYPPKPATKIPQQSTLPHNLIPSEPELTGDYSAALPQRIYSGDDIAVTCTAHLSGNSPMQWQLTTRDRSYTVNVGPESVATVYYPWLRTTNSPADFFDVRQGRPFMSTVKLKARKQLDGASLTCHSYTGDDPRVLAETRRRGISLETKWGPFYFTYGVQQAITTTQSETIDGREKFTMTCWAHVGDAHVMSWVIYIRGSFHMLVKVFTNKTITAPDMEMYGITASFQSANVSVEEGNTIVSNIRIDTSRTEDLICSRCFPYDVYAGRERHLMAHHSDQKLTSVQCYPPEPAVDGFFQEVKSEKDMETMAVDDTNYEPAGAKWLRWGLLIASFAWLVVVTGIFKTWLDSSSDADNIKKAESERQRPDRENTEAI